MSSKFLANHQNAASEFALSVLGFRPTEKPASIAGFLAKRIDLKDKDKGKVFLV